MDVNSYAARGTVAEACPFCGVDLESHLIGLDGHVFVCEVCMHEVPGPVPGQRRSGGSARVAVATAPAVRGS